MATLADLALAAVAVTVAVPLAALVLASFLPPGEYTIPPKSPTLSNYAYMLEVLGFQNNMVNTFVFIALAVAISLAVAVPTAYALARLPISRWAWLATLSTVVLAKSLPPASLLVPVYDLLWRLSLTNTPLGVALGYQVYTLPFTIWLMTSFFLDLPQAVETAARLDGAGLLARLRHVVLPMSLPGIASAVALNFLNLWNEYLYSSVLVSSSRQQTAAVVLGQMVTSEYVVEWGIMAAANVLSVLPALALLSFVQNHMAKAFIGGVKG